MESANTHIHTCSAQIFPAIVVLPVGGLFMTLFSDLWWESHYKNKRQRKKVAIVIFGLCGYPLVSMLFSLLDFSQLASQRQRHTQTVDTHTHRHTCACTETQQSSLSKTIDINIAASGKKNTNAASIPALRSNTQSCVSCSLNLVQRNACSYTPQDVRQTSTTPYLQLGEIHMTGLQLKTSMLSLVQHYGQTYGY